MFFKQKFLSDLPKKQINISKIRANFRIAVIDDNKFPNTTPLIKTGFNITEIGDIDSINCTEDFHIIICDIRGVGRSFKNESEGAFVIKEIRQRYPEKYIIAYSSDLFKNQSLIRLADKAINKATSFEVWVELLDNAILTLADPLLVWKNTKKRLIEEDLEIYSIYLLEQAFIKSMLNRDENTFTKKVEKIEMNDVCKKIINSFIIISLNLLLKNFGN